MKIVNHIKNLLKQNEKYCKDGKLFKNVVVEASLKLDHELLTILLSDKTAKETFFTEVNNIAVFDKVKFQKFISNKQFLPDSYTTFKNKIGLTTNGEYLTETNEVVLDFPYKDCVLEGGQTKDDQKRQEVFWNETLAPDEIDRLFEPKVLINWKSIRKGTNCGKIKEEIPEKLEREADGTLKDNLIIKGNNLIALHSLKQVYKGKIKLIYIDPPYNTGNDSFNYNDSFNHSTWLTFMKNRLEVARELLRNDGSIWISLDDGEVHYGKILCDEILGRENFVATIIWHSKYTTSNDAKYISYQHENILFYSKNKNCFKIGGFDRTEKQDKSYTNPDNDPKGKWKSTPIHAKSGTTKSNYTINFPNDVSWTPPEGRYPRYNKEKLMTLFNEGSLYFTKNGGVDKKTYLSEVKQTITPGSVWHYDDVGHTHGNNEEIASLLGKGIFDNPKGSKLIKKILKVANVDEKDIILDYYAGSGTTAHAVLEMNKEDGGNRKFILVEQMDYIEDIAVERMKKVIDGEQGGISKSVEWQGGGSFIYTELAKDNAIYLDKIKQAIDSKTLINIWNEIKNKPFISYKVNPKDIDQNISDFDKLSLEDQKKLLISLLDKNQMYINLSEIESVDHSVDEKDKKLNQQFYK